MNDFEKYAVERVCDLATAVGVVVPPDLLALVDHHDGVYPARYWAREHPDDDPVCCYAAVVQGTEHCTCWVAIYVQDQFPAQRPQSAADLFAAPAMCADCAYRPGSIEREHPAFVEALMQLPRSGDPFWCHHGMRRPLFWQHPDGRVVEGSPDDWTPLVINGIPYQADGTPGLLCAGWARLAATQQNSIAT